MPETRHALTRVEAVREFNRFYTRRIGVLHEGLLDSKFTLTESRLLWELAHRDPITATEIARDLELDPGYLSRLLRAFKDRGLISSTRSKDDARHQHLSLSASGRRAFAPLDLRSQAEVSALLAITGRRRRREMSSVAKACRPFSRQSAPRSRWSTRATACRRH